MQQQEENGSVASNEEPYQHYIPTIKEPSTQHNTPGHLKDHIDWVIEGWKEERPDLNIAPIAIISRLERLQAFLRPEVAAIFERFDLTGPSFEVIATLRRTGKPYQLSQHALMNELQLTGGTISVRIDRLVRDGIVQRLPDPDDFRGSLIRLTQKGKHLFDQVAPLHLANEDRLLSALNAEQREQLEALLRILVLSFDHSTSKDLNHPNRWIGATLAPAHSARKIRRVAGLPDIVGLLVQDVTVPGLAAEAGLEEGDLIISAHDIEIRSIESLYDQLLAACGEKLKLEVLRGSEYRSVYLNVDELPVLS